MINPQARPATRCAPETHALIDTLLTGEPALILLVGPAGCGKSTFAAHFAAEVVTSSDAFRAVIAGDAAEQEASPWAHQLVHTVVDGRMRFGLMTVVDATNVEARRRKVLLDLARWRGRRTAAVVFDNIPLAEALRRNRLRERRVPEDVLRAQHRQMMLSLPGLIHEVDELLHAPWVPEPSRTEDGR